MKKIFIFLLHYKYAIFALLIAFFSGLSLLHPGLPPTHDGEYHVIRFYEFDKTLREGNWYPRWAPDLNFGYGVPLFTYVYPLPNYVASLLHLLGFSFIDSFKLEMLIATLIGGLFLFLLIKEYWGDRGGLVASAFYSFSPYHFVDMYVRGSVGEVWALGLFPLWLWLYTKFVRTKNVSYFLCSTISMSLIIFSHNILALMFFLFVPFYCLFVISQTVQKRRVILYSLISIFLSLGISAIFWIPALSQTQYVQGLQIYNLQRNFPDLFQLLFPSWGTGFFDNNFTNQMSVQIGIANLFAVGVAAVAFFKHIKSKSLFRSVTAFFLTSFVFTFFLLTPFSFLIWQKAPLLHYFQFPWRLLSLTILICSVLAGNFFYKKRSILWLFLFLGILFATTYDYAHPAFYHLRTDAYYVTKSNFIDGTNSPGNAFNTIWTPTFIKRATQPATIEKGEGIMLQRNHSTTHHVFRASLHTASTIIFATTYFPSWRLTVNNKQTKIENVHGLISVTLPQGEYDIVLENRNTPTETTATYITAVSFCMLLVIGFKNLIVRKQSKIL